LQQRLSSRFFFFVHALELECIKPNPTATSLADIYLKAANLCLAQFIKASWAFHSAILPQIERGITSEMVRLVRHFTAVDKSVASASSPAS
jgi:hypothetical protein